MAQFQMNDLKYEPEAFDNLINAADNSRRNDGTIEKANKVIFENSNTNNYNTFYLQLKQKGWKMWLISEQTMHQIQMVSKL